MLTENVEMSGHALVQLDRPAKPALLIQCPDPDCGSRFGHKKWQRTVNLNAGTIRCPGCSQLFALDQQFGAEEKPAPAKPENPPSAEDVGPEQAVVINRADGTKLYKEVVSVTARVGSSAQGG